MPIAVERWPDKDPADVLDYAVQWAEQLALVTPADTIGGVTWVVPAGLVLGSQFVVGSLATCWLSGGVAGTDYTVGCRIVTTGGRTLERSVKLHVKEL